MFVYPGDAEDTRIIDIVDASIDTVFREMRILSDDDRHLWSVALVRGEGAQRGLVWLSGYDYDDTPTDGVEWQRRREMQDRYLMARSRARCGRASRTSTPSTRAVSESAMT